MRRQAGPLAEIADGLATISASRLYFSMNGRNLQGGASGREELTKVLLIGRRNGREEFKYSGTAIKLQPSGYGQVVA